MTTAGLVLAAGAGRRYGMPKALVRYEGQLLVERAVAVLESAGCPATVVLGAAEVPGLASTVVNPDWESGMGSSLRAGLRHLAGTEATAAVILLVDMPGVTAAAVRRIVAGAGASSLVMGGYGNRRGHPVLIGRDHWDGVVAVTTGDRGARDYLRANPVTVIPVDDVADDTDMDFP
ncbi:nucleotidyltransferase family protein [Actinoplanes couchii]|uniref:4-diphosphocytidyl-2C-methyl-D-erythritol synthase n=1 Tax=Actinoplanes couchii TaxID=403638 RepID=A0ABQ3X5D7_9ACTN|nr:nucleotidyltransferase family protein [Actinoplanes couchii]MDR6326034.1 CTP:molybdopterin cytidylyltransferase MocA [Actinoplanes couchii]GID53613.1 4-diphosphocytidyl-2C-methyl-D-erythritol synthase [Actinoplanes couchii]